MPLWKFAPSTEVFTTLVHFCVYCSLLNTWISKLSIECQIILCFVHPTSSPTIQLCYGSAEPLTGNVKMGWLCSSRIVDNKQQAGSCPSAVVCLLELLNINSNSDDIGTCFYWSPPRTSFCAFTLFSSWFVFSLFDISFFSSSVWLSLHAFVSYGYLERESARVHEWAQEQRAEQEERRGRGRETERQKETTKQDLGSETLRSWPELKSDASWLNHPRALPTNLLQLY